MTRQILVGLNEICQYAGMSEGVILKLIRTARFPARKTDSEGGGIWVSSCSAVDAWATSFATSGIAINVRLKEDPDAGE